MQESSSKALCGLALRISAGLALILPITAYTSAGNQQARIDVTILDSTYKVVYQTDVTNSNDSIQRTSDTTEVCTESAAVDFDSNAPSIHTPVSWPIQGSCSAWFSVPEDCWVNIGVFDLDGVIIFEIADGYFYKGGYKCYLDIPNFHEVGIVKGVYILQMKINGYEGIRKMILIR
ncbi:hypothetical protein GF359_00440 [candidate division WOR-3 bacterium]|uniref:T9SS type A sorting domain-containing protein n=1 Tax=candidate division WOR-3 bacterium TaxID=2052148 RepID=A0A9D5K7B6_UNCW3|nr:hypothetical protein [candidate division WOR-3 bacterium]MBD3363661.1 hypothetical protein [candidate division WOR-3 bacterium]